MFDSSYETWKGYTILNVLREGIPKINTPVNSTETVKVCTTRYTMKVVALTCNIIMGLLVSLKKGV